MHSLVRRYIKTAIGFLLVGLVTGGWMLARRELNGVFPGAYTVSAHTHAILVGFVMMMILGVALWLFPRPDKSDDRYRPVRHQPADPDEHRHRDRAEQVAGDDGDGEAGDHPPMLAAP